MLFYFNYAIIKGNKCCVIAITPYWLLVRHPVLEFRISATKTRRHKEGVGKNGIKKIMLQGYIGVQNKSTR